MKWWFAVYFVPAGGENAGHREQPLYEFFTEKLAMDFVNKEVDRDYLEKFHGIPQGSCGEIVIKKYRNFFRKRV